MLDRLRVVLESDVFEFVDGIFNKMGLGTVVTSIGAFFSSMFSLGLPQWLMIVSLLGGILFLIEKGLLIYIRYHTITDKDDKEPPIDRGDHIALYDATEHPRDGPKRP